jgi:hypothetical protein
MSANPDLDFLAEVRDNPNLRYDLRLTAASARLPYVTRRLASEPYIPPVPEAYSLPPLTSTKSCQEALAIVTADMVSGKLRLDTGKYFLANIQTAMESLKVSEVEAQIAEFRAIVEQVEAAKTIESQARLDRQGIGGGTSPSLPTLNSCRDLSRSPLRPTPSTPSSDFAQQCSDRRQQGGHACNHGCVIHAAPPLSEAPITRLLEAPRAPSTFGSDLKLTFIAT